MANRLTMAKIQAIRGLHEQQWSNRRISRELEVDRETVARYVRAGSCEAKPAKAPLGSEADSVEAPLGSEAGREAVVKDRENAYVIQKASEVIPVGPSS